jgi:cobalt/nickel transport system permease protein
MMIIDKLAYSSGLRYKSPMLKTAFAAGMLLICVAAHMLAVSLIILGFMAALTIRFSRVSFSHYIKLMGIPLGFLILSTLTIIFNISDTPGGLFSAAIGGIYIVAGGTSLLEGVRLIMTALASVSCLYFLTLTTPMIDILAVLRSLRCPKLVVELMMLIYRYIFVVLDMASAIKTSQNCRLGNKDFITELRSMGQMLTVLLIRSMNRSSYLFDAMESRCYNGELMVLGEHCPAKSGETILVIGSLCVMLAITVSLKLLGGVL